METARYSVILADPAWHYSLTNGDHRIYKDGKRIRHYDGLTQDAMKHLPISEIAAKNAALFMWATMPCLPDAIDLMHAWGFTYKTVAFTWIKLNKNGTPYMGLGHYTRGNAEVCLLGIRGRVPRNARNISQVLLTTRRQHSRKPDEQYDRIMRLFDGPYVEVFARQQWPSWDVWGNQTDLFPAQPFLLDEQTA